MKPLAPQAQALINTLKDIMPSDYQEESLQALLGLFLEAQGNPLPPQSKIKSESAISRFLNQYLWSTRRVIRSVRQAALKVLLSQVSRGRRPTLELIVDLTTLEKVGQFKQFKDLIRVYNGKRGLHVVMMYLVVGQWRIPWGFRVYRGKDTPSPAKLALKLIHTLPRILRERYQVMVLGDSGFGSIEFVNTVREKLKFQAIVGIPKDRKLQDGRRVEQLKSRGQQVYLEGLDFPVSLSWVWLKRDGKRVKRFVISTKPMKGTTITRWGGRRWKIEGFFKTAKHRFGLHCFGQQTPLGMYRWLVLSLTAYLLAHWIHLAAGGRSGPDWYEVAQLAIEVLLPQVILLPFLDEIERLKILAWGQGFNIQITRCKM